MRLVNTILGLALTLAGGTSDAAVWGSVTTVTAYRAEANGDIFLTTVTPAPGHDNPNPDSCSSSHWLIISTDPVTMPNFKLLYATLMTAQSTGATVTLLYDGCLKGYPRITAIATPHKW